MARPALLLGTIAGLAIFLLQPVGAGHCTSVTVIDTVVVPQAKDPALRIGRLSSLQGDGGLLAGTEVMYHFIAAPGTGAFTLKAQSIGFDLCNTAGLHSADFDITFFYDTGSIAQVLERYDSCGNENGVVPPNTSFAIIWLSAGSLAAQQFKYSTCHEL